MSYAAFGQVQSNLAALASCLGSGGSWDGSVCSWPPPPPPVGPSTGDDLLVEARQCGSGGGVWANGRCNSPLEAYLRDCEHSGGRVDGSTSWDCVLPSGQRVPRPADVSIASLETAMKAQKAGGGKWDCLAKQFAWDGTKCLLPEGTPASVVSGLTSHGTPVKIVDAATYAAAKRAKVSPLMLAAAGAVVLLGGAWWWSSRS